MKSRVLYFPYVKVPETPWLTQMLLYWDQVSSIVPSQYIAYPESLGRHMQELVHEELVQQVFPGPHICEIPRFTERFVEYLEGTGSKLDERRGNFSRHVPMRIHIEKMHEVADALVRLRLANPTKGPWYNVEVETAEDFMCYLAATLGQLDSIDASPVTDTDANLSRLVLAGVPHDRVAQQLCALRIQVLDRVLPIPSDQIEAADIRAFKDHHSAELRDFRRRVERELVAAAAIEEPALRDRQLDLFLDEAQETIDEIRASMRGVGWRIVQRGLSVVAAIPAVTPFVGLASAILDAASGGGDAQTARDFAYAAHAGVELR